MVERLSVADGRKLKLRKLKARRLTDQQVEQLRAARKAGATYKQLGAAFGLSPAGAYFIAAGVHYAETHPSPNEDVQADKRHTSQKRNQRIRELNRAPTPPTRGGQNG